MTQVQPTTGFVIRFLWACFWRSALISIPVIFVVGIATAGLFVSLGLGDLANPMARLLTLIASLVIWVPVTKRVIGKQLGAHKLVVVAAA